MSGGELAKADERLAASVVEGKPKKQTGRKYRCGSCGVQYPADELNPDFDEEGRRVGWVCDGCF